MGCIFKNSIYFSFFNFFFLIDDCTIFTMNKNDNSQVNIWPVPVYIWLIENFIARHSFLSFTAGFMKAYKKA